MQGISLKFDRLKEKQRTIRGDFSENFGLRIHRSLSWLQRAEKETDDYDAAFIFYWVAFNAAYAKDLTYRVSTDERSDFSDYFNQIIELDTKQTVYDAIWMKFSDSIRLLLDNHYVFQPFWNHHNEMTGYENWKERFEKSKKKIGHALRDQDTQLILSTVFDRLYVLRNQLIHGGATWNSSVNRSQVHDGAKILAFLTPMFIELMMDNPHVKWGAPHYPVVD